MDEPTWVSRLVVDAVHTNQIQEHGGLQGTRDENALEAALARPRNKYGYDSAVDLAALAAAYAFGLATSHPYIDGNKRTAFLAAAIFLELNGFEINRTDKEIVETMRGVAKRSVSEQRLATWIRAALVPI